MICLKCGKNFVSRALLLVHFCGKKKSTNNSVQCLEEPERQSEPSLAEMTPVNIPLYGESELKENYIPTLAELTGIDIQDIVVSFLLPLKSIKV